MMVFMETSQLLLFQSDYLSLPNNATQYYISSTIGKTGEGKKSLDLVKRNYERCWNCRCKIRIALTFAGSYSDSFISAVHFFYLVTAGFLWLLWVPGRSLFFVLFCFVLTLKPACKWQIVCNGMGPNLSNLYRSNTFNG